MKTMLCLLLALAYAYSAAAAPSPDPYIAYAFPAGGRAGSRFRILVAGQSLKGADAVLISGKGARASVLSYTGPGGPLTSLQEEELRLRIAYLVKAKSNPSAEPGPPQGGAGLPDLPDLRNLEGKSIPELKALGEKYLNRNLRPKAPMNETLEVEVVLDPEAQPGRRELRILAAGGLSNPIVFVVGDLPEISEPDRFAAAYAPAPAPNSGPFVANGQIFPGEVDSFELVLGKGETVECSVQARSLIPYLADAVPGWFQAVLALYGPDGRELAYSDDYGPDPDPRFRHTAASAGIHRLQIRDSIYRGRFDFVYRLEVRKVGAESASTPQAQPAGRASPAQAGWLSGAVSAAGETDVFKVEASAGETFVAEIRARRDGSPLDASLTLKDASGRVVAFNDDFEDRESGLATHHADSYLRHRFAESGSYSLAVGDVNGNGGPGYFYSLRLGPPREDFVLLTDKSAINIPLAGCAVFSVLAVRKDGWDGDIEIRLKNPLPGLEIQGGRIPKGKDSARMTLSFQAVSPPLPFALELEGRALVQGAWVSRPVKPADRMMQAFANLHYVQAQGLHLGFARGRPRFFSISYGHGGSLPISAGGTAEAAVFVHPAPGKDVSSLRLELVDPPAGIAIGEAMPGASGFSFIISADPRLAGRSETLILRASAVLPGTPPKVVDLGLLPALAVEVVPR